jgi:sulfatase modifying factor 1
MPGVSGSRDRVTRVQTGNAGGNVLPCPPIRVPTWLPFLPVEGVSWWDAARFCNARSVEDGFTPAYRLGTNEDIAWDSAADGYRLPTEAEWEHACRAGTTGPSYGDLDDIAWYRGNSAERAHEVGGKRPNAWGLYDTLGNVWEWTWDFADPERYGTYRVLRGGGWFDQHWSCRASVRRGSYPGLRLDDVGFRIARGQADAAHLGGWTTTHTTSQARPAQPVEPRWPRTASIPPRDSNRATAALGADS